MILCAFRCTARWLGNPTAGLFLGDCQHNPTGALIANYFFPLDWNGRNSTAAWVRRLRTPGRCPSVQCVAGDTFAGPARPGAWRPPTWLSQAARSAPSGPGPSGVPAGSAAEPVPGEGSLPVMHRAGRDARAPRRKSSFAVPGPLVCRKEPLGTRGRDVERPRGPGKQQEGAWPSHGLPRVHHVALERASL